MTVSVNLCAVLRVCVRAALAAQQYIALDLIKLRQLDFSGADGPRPSTILDLSDAQRQQLLSSLSKSVAVDVKAELAYKEGEASQDLVTTADVITQAVIVMALGVAFPDTPFTVVGEEDAAVFEDPVMLAKVRHCLDTYYSSEGTTPADIPCAAALVEYISSVAGPATNRGVVTADSIDELRRLVSIFIDPIDGTNCFVTGVWQSPMTLVGIVHKDFPVAGVVNRVFVYPIPGAKGETAASTSISYVMNCSPDVPDSAFIVHEGQPVKISPTTATWSAPVGTVLSVTQSSTTKASFLDAVADKLMPSTSVPARGASNKLFALVEKTLAERHGVCPRRRVGVLHADVFICPPHAIKKWDTCAPQAFLCALGGDVRNHHGDPVRYPPQADASTAGDAAFADLPDGVVALRGEVMQVVSQRLHWKW